MGSIQSTVKKCLEALERAKSEIKQEVERILARVSTVIEENPEIEEKTVMALEQILELVLEGRYCEVRRPLMVLAISLVLYAYRKGRKKT